MSNKVKTTKMNQGKQELVPKLRFPEFNDDGEWKIKKIGDKNFASLHKGKGISKSDIDLNGKIPCIRYGELYTRYNEVIDVVFSKTNCPVSNLFLSKKNDVIIPSSGETKIDIAKASCVTLENVSLGGDLNVIRSKDNGIFISYYLNGPKKREIAKIAQGDSVVHLYLSQLEKLELLIPKPPEQQKIADCLSSIDDLITAESEKLEFIKNHKKGLMQNLFPPEGKTIPNFRFPEFKDDEEWEVKKFSSYAKLYRGSSPRPINEFLTKNDNGVNWIKIGDTKFSSNFVIKKVEEKITKDGAKRSRFVKVGELILANSMSYGKTYQLAIDGCIYDGWFVVREYENFFYKPFLLKLLNSDFMQKQYERLAAGGIVQNISSEIVYNSKLFNTSLSEQQKIADCLSYADDLISSQAQKIDALKTHKKGLMQQIFPNIDQSHKSK